MTPGPSAEERPITELDRVALKRTVRVGARRIPRGSIGTVVGTWGNGEAFEVEFIRPFACLVTLSKNQIEPVPSPLKP